MPALSVSTWSLHRTLGAIYPDLELADGARAAQHPYGAGGMALLDVPAAVAALGIAHLEIVHFHFPRTDAAYLGALRGRLAAAGVSPATLLVDAGDISAGDEAARARDLARIRGWIDLAATIGARRVRVAAGEAAPGDRGALARCIAGLAELAEYAVGRGVRLLTENWRRLALDPASLLAILRALDGRVGLCADFGNYRAADKYDALRRILPYAETIHAKADYPADGRMDAVDFRRCLDLAREAGFGGEYVLIFDSPGDERDGLAQLAEAVRPYL